ncbi:hypothetical protein CVT26_007698 [Gymnopilus dilepis]|uniref:Uncharacterized protein n=1 Tax=Gymnopilus dilepis TaxID=231916 RepID=A0A409WII6_9AGAR|nr:hypothetical protein CVT26_007698 [Gymnopilus dilepis]
MEVMTKIVADLVEYNPTIARLPGPQRARGCRLLMRRDDHLSKRDVVSMCIAFDDVKDARKFVQEGAFIFELGL